MAFLSSSHTSETEKVNSWDGECSLLNDLDIFDKWTESKNGSLTGTRGIPPRGAHVPSVTWPCYWPSSTCRHKFLRLWAKITTCGFDTGLLRVFADWPCFFCLTCLLFPLHRLCLLGTNSVGFTSSPLYISFSL